MARASTWLPIFKDFTRDLRIMSKEKTSRDERGVPLILWESQKRFMTQLADGLDDGIRIFFWLKGRQLGITTLSLAIDIFWLATHPNLIGALVTENEKNRDKNRATIRKYIESFPPEYFGDEFGIVKGRDNDKFMGFTNGSRLDFLVAGTKKKSVAWGEGEGYTLAHLTEVASYSGSEGLASFEEAFAQTNPDRLYIYESTAKGRANVWYDRWKGGELDPFTKRSHFIGWWANPHNSIDRKHPNFQKYGVASRSAEERRLINQVMELYDWEITPEQVAWYRWRDDTATGEEAAMLEQNNPWCVVGSTRVGTARGILQIKDIGRGDRTAFGDVVHSGPTGNAPVWKARTWMGYEIEGTENHPLITVSGGQFELKDSLGAEVVLGEPMFATKPYEHRWREGVIENSVEITPDFARLVGIYMGDGSMSGSPRSGYEFAISCDSRDQDVIAECKRLLEVLFGVNVGISVYREVGDGGCTAVRANYRLIYDTFRKLGLAHTDNGFTQRRVHVPEFIWRSPKPVIKEFLRGLFEADGHSAKKQDFVVFASKHHEFVKDVQLLLLGFGITCKIFPVLGKIRKLSNDRLYSSHRMELRATEAVRFFEEIGFLSERKISVHRDRVYKNKKLSDGKRRPIVLVDKVVSVENTGRTEEVFNLTVDFNHWFDANGIVTHNTAEQAFVVTGYSFFAIRALNKAEKKIYDEPEEHRYTGYRYHYGDRFFDLSLEWLDPEQGAKPEDIELCVWEEPKENGRYVIGVDPAFGGGDDSDQIVISVWRCYADCLEQVAEYATNRVEPKRAAWVLAHLAGAYKDCIVNLELAGGGTNMMQELDGVRMLLKSEMYADVVRTRDWEDALGWARWYLYHRPDSMGKGYMYNTKISYDIKRRMVYGYQGAFVTNEILIHSLRLIEEMMNVRVDGDEIGAPNGQHDDRMTGAALACMAWNEWRKPEMIAEGLTRERVKDEASGKSSLIVQRANNLVYRFMQTLEQQHEEAKLMPAPTWREERGI